MKFELKEIFHFLKLILILETELPIDNWSKVPHLCQLKFDCCELRAVLEVNVLQSIFSGKWWEEKSKV